MIETEIDAARRIAVHRCIGDLLMEDVLIAGQRLFSNPDFGSDYGVVWDLRQSRIAITLEEIVNLNPAIVALANASRPSGRTAWVASTALGESIIKLLYGQHDWGAEWRTFSTLETAIGWCTQGRRP